MGDPSVSAMAAAALLERRKLRVHLSPFIQKTFETVDPGATFLPNWHIDLISEYLEACYYREIPKLVINMPPRFIKSIAVSVALSAWVLGRDPSEQILCASYSGKLSMKHSVDTRLVLESPWYRATFPGVLIARDQNEKSKFQTTKRGHRIATSVGGTTTGEGGNFLILDDPMNPMEALSEAERKTANEWFDQTWSSRKNNPKTAVEIIVMQRLHIDDTSGHALKQGGWEHLVIPQEAGSKTTITFPRSGRVVVRKKGDLIHPERFDSNSNKEAKARLGSYGYAGQQQQTPVPVEGGRIRLSWFPRYGVVPVEFDETMFSLDTAQKPKNINDPSVIEVFGRVGAKWYLVAVWKDRVRYPELKKTAISWLDHWKPDAVLIEDKSTGSSLIQELNDCKEGYPIIPIEPEADKITRMDTQTPSIEAGVIMLPDPEKIKTSWLFDLESNLQTFPSPKEFDEIDAMSQFIKYIRKRNRKEDDTGIVPFGVTGDSRWRT